jgi:anti-sigma B factor antagonist
VEISVVEKSGVAVVTIAGKVDTLTAPRVARTFAEQTKYHLVADLTLVEYIGSAGVHALLAALKNSRARGGDLRLVNARPTVRRVLDLSGLSHLVQFFSDVNAAAASFGHG